jgi:hypothetical protein
MHELNFFLEKRTKMGGIPDYTHYLQQCLSITETIQQHLGKRKKLNQKIEN